jgi:hypothetical protein
MELLALLLPRTLLQDVEWHVWVFISHRKDFFCMVELMVTAIFTAFQWLVERNCLVLELQLLVRDDFWSFNVTGGLWTWIGGSSGFSIAGVYGAQKTSTANVKPGARFASSCWVTQTDFWLFGGRAAAPNFDTTCKFSANFAFLIDRLQLTLPQ